jgi:hypothetical protein
MEKSWTIDDNILPEEAAALWERNGTKGSPERLDNIIAGIRDGDEVTAICTALVRGSDAYVSMFSENHQGRYLLTHCEELLKGRGLTIILRLANPKLCSPLMRRFFESRGYVFNKAGTRASMSPE